MATEQLSKKNNLALITESFASFVVLPFLNFGISGFAFDVEGTTTIEQQAEITDHYVEDNTAIQDHMAVKPIKVKLNNFVGEVVTRRESSALRKAAKVVQKLTTVLAFLPAITAAASQTRNLLSGGVSDFSDVTDLSGDIWSLIKNLNPFATEQQKAYLFFKALQEKAILVSVQTPHAFFTDMAIESLIVKQDEKTKSISDFSITLKQIRTASIQTVDFDKDKYQSRNKQQRQAVSKKGKAVGRKTSVLKGGLNSIGSLISKVLGQ